MTVNCLDFELFIVINYSFVFVTFVKGKSCCKPKNELINLTCKIQITPSNAIPLSGRFLMRVNKGAGLLQISS